MRVPVLSDAALPGPWRDNWGPYAPRFIRAPSQGCASLALAFGALGAFLCDLPAWTYSDGAGWRRTDGRPVRLVPV